MQLGALLFAAEAAEQRPPAMRPVWARAKLNVSVAAWSSENENFVPTATPFRALWCSSQIAADCRRPLIVGRTARTV